jgi:hypothetical protein
MGKTLAQMSLSKHFKRNIWMSRPKKSVNYICVITSKGQVKFTIDAPRVTYIT